MFPASTPRPGWPFGGGRSGAATTMLTAPSVGHAADGGKRAPRFLIPQPFTSQTSVVLCRVFGLQMLWLTYANVLPVSATLVSRDWRKLVQSNPA